MEEKNLQLYEPPSSNGARQLTGPALPYAPEDAEEKLDLRAYWRALRKWQWTLLTVWLAIFTLALIGTLKQTPAYRAKTLIEIQKENPDIPSVQELFELETVSDSYLETQYKVLASDSLARRVIEQLNLERLEEFSPSKGWWLARWKTSAAVQPSAPEASPDSQEVLERFRKRLSVEPVRRSRLVAVSFESQDPQRAARIANALAALYIEQSLEARWEATQKASEWLSQQLLGVKAKLEKSEDELQRYAWENGLLFLESEKGNPESLAHQRLRQLQEELTRAQSARYEKESLYRLVQAGDYGSLPSVFDNKLLQDLTVRLAELRREQAQLSTTFHPHYPRAQQLQNQIAQVESTLERERGRAVQRITNDYVAAVQRESLIRQAFEEQQKHTNRVAEKSVHYNILKREVETNQELYQGLLQRLKQAGVSAGLKASNIRIVDPAQPPRKPAKPQLVLNLGLAFFLGLALGIGAVFFQEYLDNTLKNTEDIERFLHMPALALIPSVDSLKGGRGVYGLFRRGKASSGGESPGPAKPIAPWYRIDLEAHRHSPLAEAFRSLRTSVLLSSADHPPRSLLITSAQPAEGKTTVATNLAISLAQLGQSVLLVDVDLRRPSLHKLFGMSESPGLVGYLTGQQDWMAAVQAAELKGLDLLFSGPVPPNPAELLSSERMQVLMREAKARYAFVVLDSPPLLHVADSRILATLVGGVILVVRAGATPHRLVQRARSGARDVGANIIGTVLNRLDIRNDDSYDAYRYEDYYYVREQSSHTV